MASDPLVVYDEAGRRPRGLEAGGSKADFLARQSGPPFWPRHFTWAESGQRSGPTKEERKAEEGVDILKALNLISYITHSLVNSLG